MNLNELRNDLSRRSKNGIPFLLAAIVIWSLLLVIFLMPYEIRTKNILTFYSTGLMFPLAIFISKVIKADWKTDGHPLSSIGMYLNLAQLMYFPLVFFAFGKNPEQMIMVLAVITGAHFFPYGWLYNAKGYMVMAPVISILVTILGAWGGQGDLWMIPLIMIATILVLCLWLYLDFKQKNNTGNLSMQG